MDTFNEFLKQQLNPEQQKAVLHKNGAILVIAGAGSGKTRIITARITQLILNENVDPKSIVALTFTNKAAGEMKERIARFLKDSISMPFIGTFHSYCLLLLRQNSKVAPFENFSILDDEDQIALIRKIIKRYGLEKQITAAQALSQISSLKNKLLFSPDEKNLVKSFIRDIHDAYESERKISRSLDFDDLLLETLKLFTKNLEFKEKFQSKIKHLLVDEYQDTNIIQHELLKHMALNNSKNVMDSICAVGDEDQSIYSWRGALVANILNFEKNFEPVTKIKIEQNYRSVEPILKIANTIIENNQQRNKKELWSTRKANNRVVVISNKSEYQEADAISLFLETLPNNNTAILYRTHFQSRVIEEALISKGIPYKIIGGIQFYQRKEIKDILAYLRIIANPFDRVSFFRILNVPSRGIGNVFENLIIEEWEQDPKLNCLELLEKIVETDQITQSRKESLQGLIDVFYGLDKYKKTSFLIKTILDKTVYTEYLRKDFEEREAESKIENIRELQQSVTYYEDNESNTNKSLENFLQEVALMQEATEKKELPSVLLMTLHAAKGLEFNNVIITGLEENLLPSTRSLISHEALEEERRLFYVGITRAKERLILSHSQTRNSFGQMNEQVSSRFIDEVPKKFIQEINAVYLKSFQIKELWRQWLGSKAEKEIIFFGGTTSSKPMPIKKITKAINSFINTNEPWRKNQLVMHKKFGTGIIKKVEKRDHEIYFITAAFKSGEKTLLSNFLTLI